MGFGKSVFAKPQNLLVDTSCKPLTVAALTHAPDQPLLIVAQSTVAFPGGHVPPQAVSLSRCKPGCHHGQFDNLFLEDWDPQGAF